MHLFLLVYFLTPFSLHAAIVRSPPRFAIHIGLKTILTSIVLSTPDTGIAFVDRKFATGGWENVFFVDKFSRAVIPQPSVGNTVDVLAVIDRGILETFFNGGIDVNTSIYFFGGGRKPARLRVVWGEGETVTANELRVVALKRTWDC